MHPVSPQRGRVLVVDDDLSCARDLAALLRADGFEVATIGHGVGVFDAMRTRAPDALVADLAVPGMDGATLLRRVRDEFADTLVVVVSGDLSEAIPLLEGGVLACVAKPVQIDEIVSVLDAGLQMRDEGRRAL